MDINAENVKTLVEEYIELENNEASEKKLHEIGHKIDHEVFRNDFYIILNVAGSEPEVATMLMEESDEFFIPVYTSKDETDEAIEFFKTLDDTCEFDLEIRNGNELVQSYIEEEGFLGLAINAPQCDFVVFAQTIHDCDE